jgi:hypothetical protein
VTARGGNGDGEEVRVCGDWCEARGCREVDKSSETRVERAVPRAGSTITVARVVRIRSRACVGHRNPCCAACAGGLIPEIRLAHHQLVHAENLVPQQTEGSAVAGVRAEAPAEELIERAGDGDDFAEGVSGECVGGLGGVARVHGGDEVDEDDAEGPGVAVLGVVRRRGRAKRFYVG